MMVKLLAREIPLEQTPGIIQRCIAGDREAQSELFHQYCDAMFTICCRILGDRDLAADALQESFIEVFRSLKGFREESTVGAWIKTIAVRTACKKLKAEFRYEAFDLNVHDQAIEMPEKASMDVLEKTILQLPAGYRNIFCLVEIEGYKHAEVAKILGISENTSRSQLFHAKKMLQDKLKSEWK